VADELARRLFLHGRHRGQAAPEAVALDRPRRDLALTEHALWKAGTPLVDQARRAGRDPLIARPRGVAAVEREQVRDSLGLLEDARRKEGHRIESDREADPTSLLRDGRHGSC